MAKFENDEPEFEDDYGDFGDFKAADSPVLGPRFAQVPQFQSPRKNVRNEEQNEMKPEIGIRSSENNKASLIASQSEKKPGESQSGIFGKPGSGPIPLDIFGEDDVPQKDVPSFENLYGPRHTPGGQNFSRGEGNFLILKVSQKARPFKIQYQGVKECFIQAVQQGHLMSSKLCLFSSTCILEIFHH